MKSKEIPLISIIMPVFNAGDFLWEALESIGSQTFRNFEILAVDDGSSDESLIILKAYAKRDKRLKIFHTPKNHGLSHAANIAISHSKSEFIARFDADDIMPSDRLEMQVEFLQQNPDIVVVGGQCALINDDGKFISKKLFPLVDESIRKMSFLAMSLQAGSMMVNRKLIPRDFTYYTSQYRYAEDHELLFKLMQFGKVANLNETLLYYRQHGENSTKISSPKGVFGSVFKIRQQALKRGFYPGLLPILMNYFEYGIISLVPEKAIPILFSLARGTRSTTNNIKSFINFSGFLPRFSRAVSSYIL